MKVVITGVAGFVGSSLAARLLRRGDTQVLGIDRLTDYYDPALKRANLETLTGPNFTFLDGDLNTLSLAKLLSGARYIFHQAGQPGVRKSWGLDFASYTSDNVNATQRLLEAAKECGDLQALVYASSSSIYGDAERYPTLESDTPKPLSPYGVTKLAAEHLANLYAKNFDVPTVSLRYFTVYGPRQRPDMAFTRFLTAVRDDTSIEIFGDGEQVRDFTYIDDIVEANIRAAEASLTPGTVMNVAGGSSVSVNDVLAVISEVTGREPRVSYKAAVNGDVRRTGGSTDVIRKSLDWEPRVSVQAGLAQQWRWINSPLVPATLAR